MENISIIGILVIVSLFGAWRIFDIRGTLSRKAALANDILNHGRCRSALVYAAWTGSDYKGLDEKLDSWGAHIRALAQEYNNSPFLHDVPRKCKVRLVAGHPVC